MCRNRIAVILLILVGGTLPIAVYWPLVGRVPSVSPEEARAMLADHTAATALVDVRSAEEFQANHLEDAENWPYAEIAGSTATASVPERLQGKRLLLICDSGLLSAAAVRKLREFGVANVFNVQGGLQEWIAGGRPCAGGACRLKLAGGEIAGLPFRESTGAEQWGAVLTGFVAKPFYTTLALVLAIWLWRRKQPELVALRWAMLFFFVGENFCAANYLIYGERSDLFEYLHSFGMVVCFGLTAYAVFEGMDRWFLRLSDSDERCAAMGLCRRCIKYADAPCGLERVFLVVIPAAIVMCFMPLTAELLPLSYNTEIFGTYYNYSHAVAHQLFEIRYLPAAAMLLFGVSWAVLWFRGSVEWSKLFFTAGVGAIGFSFFRLILLQVYRDQMAWFGIWEEITELLFIFGAAIVLWIFRQGLFTSADRAAATE